MSRTNMQHNLRTTGAIKDESETDRMRFRWMKLIHYTFCSHCVLFSVALSRVSSFLSCQVGSAWGNSGAEGESRWRELVTWKSPAGRHCSTSGRIKV